MPDTLTQLLAMVEAYGDATGTEAQLDVMSAMFTFLWERSSPDLQAATQAEMESYVRSQETGEPQVAADGRTWTRLQDVDGLTCMETGRAVASRPTMIDAPKQSGELG